MDILDEKIFNLKQQIKDCKSQLKPSLLCKEDDYQEQLEIRWHIDELESQLDYLLLQNRAEEEIEGW